MGAATATGALTVKAAAGTIVVENAKGRVSVYDAAGALLRSATPTDGCATFTLPQGRVYVVKAGGSATKVAM